jgi:hypothetical protein
LGEYGQQRMNDNLRLLAKDAFIVSLALFLIFSWFEWRNPGAIAGLFTPKIPFALALFFFAILFENKIRKYSPKSKEKLLKIFSSLFLISLIIILIGTLEVEFIARKIFLQNIINFFEKGTFCASAIALFSGFLILFTNKNKPKKDGEVIQANKIPAYKNSIKQTYKKDWKFIVPFLFLVLAFIAIKITMPIVYNGSYIDEYSHAISGTNFLETGKLDYIRGAYVSFLTGLLMNLFGKTITIAKILPATLGIINFFLLYSISKYFIKKRFYKLVLLFSYMINPWTIFNHFYIRMYVFYEFFLLATILLFIKILSTKKNNKQNILYVILLLLINTISLLLSYDAGRILIFAFNIILSLLFFSYFKKISLKNIIIPSLVLVFIIFALNLPIKIIETLSTKTVNISPYSDYLSFFFSLNAIPTIFFVMFLIFVYSLEGDRVQKIIFGGILFLLAIHLLVPENFKTVRNLFYLLPMFYLFGVASLEKINIDKKSKLIISLLFILTMINNYPSNFLKHPFVPGEINYIDNSVYSDIIKNCDHHIIIMAGIPEIAIFNRVLPKYILDVTSEQKEKNYRISDNKKTTIPIINTHEEFLTILNSSNNICFLGGELSYKNIGENIFQEIYSSMEKFPKEYRSSRETLFFIKKK